MNSTQEPNYPLTPSDKLFYQLMGFYPTKRGTAFELIATAVTNIIQKSDKVQHNQKVKGLTTATHQIDGIVGNVAVEAKDHASGEQHPVGIGELRNFEGAICDIEELESGKFWTSTKYTREAQKYANGLSPVNRQKLIQLFESRPSTDADRKGRVETVAINLAICHNDDTYQLCLQQKEIDFVNSLSDKGYYTILFDKDGNETRTFDKAVDDKYGSFNDIKDGMVKSENEFIRVSDTLIPIDGFIVNRRIIQETEKFDITANGNPVLLVMCEEICLNKLFTDVEIIREINHLIQNTQKYEN